MELALARRPRGDFALDYEVFDVGAVTVHAEPHMHVQWAQYETQTEGLVTLPDGKELEVRGLIEQMLIGTYHPAGLTGLTDAARP
jgi:hypothetical protein